VRVSYISSKSPAGADQDSVELSDVATAVTVSSTWTIDNLCNVYSNSSTDVGEPLLSGQPNR
jgi:hypothetical protein